MNPEPMSESESEVVRRLAIREGWTQVGTPDGIMWLAPDWKGVPRRAPDYLTSHDALRPVLAKLTPEEWSALRDILWRQHQKVKLNSTDGDEISYVQFLLILDPRTLAFAVAEVIGKDL